MKITAEDIYELYPQLKTGEVTVIEPQYPNEWIPDWCKECKTWHRIAFTEGWDISTDGVLYLIVWEVDEDGDWERCEEAEIGTEDFYRLIETYFLPTSFSEKFREYYEWVIENGEDPAGMFTVYSKEELIIKAKEAIYNQELLKKLIAGNLWKEDGNVGRR